MEQGVVSTVPSARRTASSVERLTATVLSGGYCIGCGACTAVSGSPMQIELDDLGQFRATPAPGEELNRSAEVARVCPFSDEAENEDQIGRRLFGESGQHSSLIGYHRAAYAGFVSEGDYRARGSSGGVGKWILCELLRSGEVDAVIEVAAVAPDENGSMLYRYDVRTTPEEALQGSKSVYYPVEMSAVLAYVRDNPGRYAITGIPCFVKAIRLLARHEEVFAQRIKYCVGIICGHLKSTRYAEMIGWQLGVSPEELGYIDFRKKLPGAKANQKGVEVRHANATDNQDRVDIVQNLFGTNYNHGFFQYRACDYCDDVVGETADISVGDAWLPEYIKDGKGTSVVVVRHPRIAGLIEAAMADGRLSFTAVSEERVVESQAGGFRQRREGLRYRLHLTDSSQRWRPPKRVAATARGISRRRKQIYRLRIQLSETSHAAYAVARRLGDFEAFRQEMVPLLSLYQALYAPRFPLLHRLRRAIQRRIGRTP